MTINANVSLYSELLILGGESDYRGIYHKEYCNVDIYTHDGFKVSFPPNQFDHAFFKNQSRRKKDKSIFCADRSKRILWIKKVLSDASLTYYAGWDSKKRKYDQDRRVTLITPDNYVVVLRIKSRQAMTASFVTAYLIDDPDVERKIKSSPLWVL
ncbi:hypothetical protein [Sutcliffiella halmapala]|uniref:hypothetical protein n=1 Tax=Sutcliffiella halmapala TaxID=79882 RepID=UPI000995262D|nr:hypothetical protein [Sutcliffiella halmapala]